MRRASSVGSAGFPLGAWGEGGTRGKVLSVRDSLGRAQGGRIPRAGGGFVSQHLSVVKAY